MLGVERRRRSGEEGEGKRKSLSFFPATGHNTHYYEYHRAKKEKERDHNTLSRAIIHTTTSTTGDTQLVLLLCRRVELVPGEGLR